MAEKKPKAKKVTTTKKRTKLSQKDVPSMSLDKSLAVAKAIVDNYASKPASPLQVARALNVTPTSGPFRMLCGASVAYGLTKGGYNVDQIELLPLGKRILKPTTENDDLRAKVEAFSRPRVINEFINKYNGSPIPRKDIAKNVLEEMGMPLDKAEYVLEMIIEQGEALGIITTLKNKKYVEIPTNLEELEPQSENEQTDEDFEDEYIEGGDEFDTDNQDEEPIVDQQVDEDKSKKLKRVFVTHGKNRGFIEPIKKLLKFGELEAMVSVEKTSVSVPVPDKVMNDMRSCGAAIIHVEDEMKLLDKDAKEHLILNPNVLIEIGAAMALFGRRFILLVKNGVKLPSNLQGLFEVRYDGDTLDGDATIRLLEAINDIKNQKLPD